LARLNQNTRRRAASKLTPLPKANPGRTHGSPRRWMDSAPHSLTHGLHARSPMQTAQARPHSPLLHDPVPIDAPAAVRTATAQKATLSLSPLSYLCCSRNEKESERWAASHGVAVPLLHYTTPHQLSHIDRMRAMRMRAGARFQQPWRVLAPFSASFV
jgi:hypothetical protein